MDARPQCWKARKGLGPCCLFGEGAAVLCAVPDLRQSETWNCGEAAVRCVLAYHQFAASVLASVRISSPIDGVDPLAVERFLAKLGLRTLAGNMKTADLRSLCDSLRPVVTLIHPADAHDSHWVVARGVSRGQVHYQDVAAGPSRCSVGAWEAMWVASDGRRGHPYESWGICAWPAA
jgi:predicted double-glycine peptidase